MKFTELSSPLLLLWMNEHFLPTFVLGQELSFQALLNVSPTYIRTVSQSLNFIYFIIDCQRDKYNPLNRYKL